MTFQSKEEAIEAMEAARREWLDAARSLASTMGIGGAEVTVDDVRRVAPKLPDEADPRVFGAIFRAPDWVCIGYRKSTRKVCHKRPIGVFVRSEYAAEHGITGMVM